MRFKNNKFSTNRDIAERQQQHRLPVFQSGFYGKPNITVKKTAKKRHLALH